jgi:hypothetical protein
MCAKEPPRPRAPMIDWGWVGRVGLRGWKILDRSLRETSKRTGGLTLLVSAIALCFVVAGYRLQKKSDRPMLAYTGSTGSRILQSETAISSNNGKQPGRGGVATLSIVHEDRQGPEKVTSAPIEPGADAQTFYRALVPRRLSKLKNKEFEDRLFCWYALRILMMPGPPTDRRSFFGPALCRGLHLKNNRHPKVSRPPSASAKLSDGSLIVFRMNERCGRVALGGEARRAETRSGSVFPPKPWRRRITSTRTARPPRSLCPPKPCRRRMRGTRPKPRLNGA